MEKGIFAYIWRFSKTQQIALLLMSVASMPVYFLSLQLPKNIVDDGIGGNNVPRSFFGVELDQLGYLWLLCAAFLALVFVNGAFKYVINVYKGSVGERMLRRLRYELISRIMRFPLPQFRKTSQGEVVSMIALETEPLGGFFADALSTPVFQGGQLFTLMLFMFVQDWKLGLAAIALYPLQAYLIPKFQRRVNELGKQRVLTVRQLSERIGEAVTGAPEIHANDTSRYELSDFSRRLGRIYAIRFDIYKLKFFIKFLNNFLALLTPFFFYSIGGWLVIRGDLSIGALVAILSAYKDVSAPWKQLLNYYQRMEDARIKYQQIADKFQPAGMLAERLQVEEPEEVPEFSGKLVASNVSLSEDDGLKVIDGASLSLELPRHVMVTGSGGSGKGEFSQILARLLMPDSGRITIGDMSLNELPETVVGRQVAYVGQNAYIFSGTIRDNLLYGLKHRPQSDVEHEGAEKTRHEWEIKEARSSGNLELDPTADWVDPAGAGGNGDLFARIDEVLKMVGLADDVYGIGIRQTIDPAKHPELADSILKARAELRARLEDEGVAQFVEVFDPDKFNTNASVAENIIFGTPVGNEFAIDRLGENPFVLQVLDEVGLSHEFLEKGRRLAEIMIDLFQGLPADHEFFERFSFISSDDLPEFSTILKRVAQEGLDAISEEDRARLRALPFRLIPARHHLDLIDQEFQQRLLEARRAFHANIPEEMAASVEFFDVEKYNAASTIQDNILFGKRASERAGSFEKVRALLAEVIDAAGLRRQVLELGLDTSVGIGGSRLSSTQRQKLAVARALMKRPQILVMNEALGGLDSDTQGMLLSSIKQAQDGRTLIYVNGAQFDNKFDQIVRMEGGRVVDAGAGAPPPVSDAEQPAAEIAGGFGEEIDVLASIPLFRGIDRSRLKLLAFASERHIYDPDQMVLKQGEVGENAFIVLEGEADILLDTLDGPMVIGSFGKNDLFGELALLCEAPRTASIVARTHLTVLSISKEVFIKLVAEDVEMSARITRDIADRLERTTRDLSLATAVRDPVTSLSDTRLFADRLRNATARARRFNETSALMCFSLETLLRGDGGLSQTDRETVLRTIAMRVKSCTRETDTAARLDELDFGLLLSPIEPATEAKPLAQRVADQIAAPIELSGGEVQLADECEFRFMTLDGRDPDSQLAACRNGEGATLRMRGRPGAAVAGNAAGDPSRSQAT